MCNVVNVCIIVYTMVCSLPMYTIVYVSKMCVPYVTIVSKVRGRYTLYSMYVYACTALVVVVVVVENIYKAPLVKKTSEVL